MKKNCAYCKKTIKKDLWSTFNGDFHWDCYIKFFDKKMDEYKKEHCRWSKEEYVEQNQK